MPRLIGLAVTDQPETTHHFIGNIKRIWANGDAFATIDLRLPKTQLDKVLDALRPSAIVYGNQPEQSLPFSAPTQEGDAVVVATSGTSGQPKGVVHTHASVAASAIATSTALSVDPSADRWLACLPLSHIGGLAVVLRSIVTDTPVEIHPRFDADAVAQAAEGGATLVSLVTRALAQIDPELFRTILIGGAAPPPERAPNVVATYGMTETGSGVIYDTTVLDGLEISLSDRTEPTTDTNETLPSDQGSAPPSTLYEQRTSSEILLRGPMLFRGYRSGANPFRADGWFPTGDEGYWGKDGKLVVVGRSGDVIVTGGEKVWPAPIEKLLGMRQDIAEVALVGRPDREWGHRVVAVVVPTDVTAPPTLSSMREAVKQNFGPWCAPKELELRSALPKTSLGKVLKGEL